jgi:ribosomal protein S18 acetylase RimI-like enzyme
MQCNLQGKLTNPKSAGILAVAMLWIGRVAALNSAKADIVAALERNVEESVRVNIELAAEKHIPEVARLFDLYRQFYECAPDIELAMKFISARIANGESTIFVATDNAVALGFVQLYPSFCSVEAVKIQILYDLYVDAAARQRKVGEKLMNRASEFARDSGASRVDLLTEHSNTIGQHLYEKLGYEITNKDFHAYSLYV